MHIIQHLVESTACSRRFTVGGRYDMYMIYYTVRKGNRVPGEAPRLTRRFYCVPARLMGDATAGSKYQMGTGRTNKSEQPSTCVRAIVQLFRSSSLRMPRTLSAYVWHIFVHTNNVTTRSQKWVYLRIVSHL